MTENKILQDKMKTFGLNGNDTDEDCGEDRTSDFALMAINKEEYRGNFKYDALEYDAWIGDTGASAHMTNSDEGMFGCTSATNQHIQVDSRERERDLILLVS